MKVAVGSDERTPLTDFVVQELARRGIEVELWGALRGEAMPWPEVAELVAERVARGQAQEGLLFCWTGTGVSIAANKVPGIRAALCADAFTARGAREWNHANILVLGLRLTSREIAREVLDAWLSTPFGGGEDARNVERVCLLEGKYLGSTAR